MHLDAHYTAHAISTIPSSTVCTQCVYTGSREHCAAHWCSIEWRGTFKTDPIFCRLWSDSMGIVRFTCAPVRKLSRVGRLFPPLPSRPFLSELPRTRSLSTFESADQRANFDVVRGVDGSRYRCSIRAAESAQVTTASRRGVTCVARPLPPSPNPRPLFPPLIVPCYFTSRRACNREDDARVCSRRQPELFPRPTTCSVDVRRTLRKST